MRRARNADAHRTSGAGSLLEIADETDNRLECGAVVVARVPRGVPLDSRTTTMASSSEVAR